MSNVKLSSCISLAITLASGLKQSFGTIAETVFKSPGSDLLTDMFIFPIV